MFADAPTQPVGMMPQAMGHMPSAPPGMFNPASGMPQHPQQGGGGAGVPPWMMGQRMPTRAPAQGYKNIFCVFGDFWSNFAYFL